jgi:hypothetical protein
MEDNQRTIQTKDMIPVFRDQEQCFSKPPSSVLRPSAIMDKEYEAIAGMDDENFHGLKEPKWDVIEE